MRVVVRRQRPWVGLLVVLIVGLASATAGWHLVRAELANRAQQGEALASERDRLFRENVQLSRAKQELERRFANLERTAQVEAQAYARVDEHLEALQNEILALKEEVAFYRGIVSDDSRHRVRIQRFLVEREGEGRSYRFLLVLTRGIRNDKVVEGSVMLFVDGDERGESRRLRLRDLMPMNASDLEFSFKHFQRLEGRIELPETFIPRQVIIEVSASEGDVRPVREIFEWPAVES